MLTFSGCQSTETPDNNNIPNNNEATNNQEAEVSRAAEDETKIYIPRELFFTRHLQEDDFFMIMEAFGGEVDELYEDADTFWDNYPENAEAGYLGVTLSYLDLNVIQIIMEDDLEAYLEAIVSGFDSILSIEKKTSETYTRFILEADIDELINDQNAIVDLLDFLLPYISQFEYLRRIFSLYDMTLLEKIVFYVEDPETLERLEFYSFFHDAPEGLAMRHILEDNGCC